MHCSNCGAALGAGTSFCAACGTPVATTSAAPAAPVQPQVYNNAPYTNAAPVAKTNALAIVSLVLSVLCFQFIAAILGHVALGQIKRTGEQGKGMALAGVIIGWVTTFFGIIWIIAMIGLASSSSSYYY